MKMGNKNDKLCSFLWLLINFSFKLINLFLHINERSDYYHSIISNCQHMFTSKTYV